MSFPYRSDIDGLRAIAIIGVLFFHADVFGFSGGYIGVDVFFVISGFLITLLIQKDLLNNSFSIKGFYLRRLRRLAPSLLVVLLTTWLTGYLALSDEEFIELGKTILSSLAFVSNWYFLTNSNYFDPSLETFALLHTWSLSIEEQYYVFWPLILVIMHKAFADKTSKRTAMVSVLLLASLGLSVWLINNSSPQNAFFHTLGRVWELLAGALVALSHGQFKLSRYAATGFRLAGLICIIPLMFIYTDKTSFPGLAAILPVLGTSLLLAATVRPEGLIYRVLTLFPVQYFGKISYSLYLWHWPILVFSKIFWPSLSLLATLSLLIIAVILASLTTHLIENPIRFQKRWPTNKALITKTLLGSVLIAFLGIYSVLSKGVPQRWNYETINLHSVQYNFDKAFDVGRCFIDDRHKLTDLIDGGCLVPQKGKTNILVIGDSFAAHIMPGLRHHFPDVHFNQATGSACRGVKDFIDPNNTWDWAEWKCPELNDYIFTDVVKNTNYDAILLASDWQFGEGNMAGKIDGPKLIATINFLKQVSEAPIIVLGNTPVYQSGTKIGLRSHTLTGHRTSTSLSFRKALLEMDAFNEEHLHGAHFVSLLENFCVEQTCPLVTSGGNMVHFGIHLTEWGAIEIIGAAKQDLAKIINDI